jgi:hypothetical protein
MSDIRRRGPDVRAFEAHGIGINQWRDTAVRFGGTAAVAPHIDDEVPGCLEPTAIRADQAVDHRPVLLRKRGEPEQRGAVVEELQPRAI